MAKTALQRKGNWFPPKVRLANGRKKTRKSTGQLLDPLRYVGGDKTAGAKKQKKKKKRKQTVGGQRLRVQETRRQGKNKNK